MPSFAKNTTSNVIPALHYRDAPAMIEWLCRAFGFEKHFVHEDGEGGIAHAQLSFGSGMIMVSTAKKDGPWVPYFAQPDEIGGRETQTCCLIVADCDAHYAQAAAAGIEVIDPLADKPYGGRGYGCKDPEGHIWWIGSYDPYEQT